MTRLFAGTPFDIPPRCELCGQLEAECGCTAAEKAAAEEQRQREALRRPAHTQRARVRCEKRKGKRIVTVVDGLTAEATDLGELLSRLKTDLGAGGTVKDDPDRIEIQGDHRERVGKKLSELGFRVQA